MEIEYTDYAEFKINKRGLLKSDIEITLRNSEKIVEGKEGRKIAQKVIGKHLMRVVFEQHGNRYKVITVYYSKPQRYG